MLNSHHQENIAITVSTRLPVCLSVCLSVWLTDFLGAGRRLRGVVGVVVSGGCGGVFTCHCCPSGQLLDTVRCKLPSARPVAVCTYCAQGFVAIMTQWSWPLFIMVCGGDHRVTDFRNSSSEFESPKMKLTHTHARTHYCHHHHWTE